MSPATPPALDTKTSLLDAAERLFAEHGVTASSLRAITRAAGANLAAVHYHFGSKEALVQAVFARRLAPLNRQRLAALSRCEADGCRDLDAIVRAFVAPPLRMIRDTPGGRDFARLVARAFLEPAAETRQLVLAQFEEVIGRFTAALGRALPGLDRDELHWRFHFMAGSMAFTAGLSHLVERRLGSGPTDVEQLIRRLSGFLAGGMTAPPAPERAR